MQIIVAGVVANALEELHQRACVDNTANVVGDGGAHDIVCADGVDQKSIDRVRAHDCAIDDGVHAFGGC